MFTNSSIHLPIHPYIYLFVHMFTYLSIHLPIRPYLYLFIHTFTYSSIRLPIRPYVYLFVHTFTYSSIHLPIRPYIYLFIHTFTYSSIHLLIRPYAFSIYPVIHFIQYTYLCIYSLTELEPIESPIVRYVHEIGSTEKQCPSESCKYLKTDWRTVMIMCQSCETWYHSMCVKVLNCRARFLSEFTCPTCRGL